MQWWNIKYIYTVFPFYATVFYSEANSTVFPLLTAKVPLQNTILSSEVYLQI